MTPYSRSLPFTDVSEITFHPGANEVLIKVNGADLGSINLNYAVTVFIEITTAGKKIWMKEISDAVYRLNNNNDAQRTIVFDQADQRANLRIRQCPTANVFKIVGWEDENNAISCTGGSGYDTYFMISAENNFKARIETLSIQGAQVNRMVVRYGQNIIIACPGNPDCCNNLFCYICI